MVVVLDADEKPADLLARLAHDAAQTQAPRGGEREHAQREWRQLGLGAQILADLGVRRLRVLGTPRKLVGLSGFGLEVVEYVDDAGDGKRETGDESHVAP